jgi:ubiquitin-conjugating enzyme E2 A
LITASITANLTRELRAAQEECMRGPLSFTMSPRDWRLSLWDAVINGPENSIWSGTKLKAELHFPDDHPNSPTIFFKTRNMSHPNI